MSIDITHISKIIEDQFPSFIRSDYGKFVSFLESYYEWLGQEHNNLWTSKHLMKMIDIDDTLDKFIINFKHELADAFPNYNKVSTSEETFENYFDLLNNSENTESNIEDQDEFVADGITTTYTLSHHPNDKDTLQIIVRINDEYLNEHSGRYFINAEKIPATLQFLDPEDGTGTTPIPLDNQTKIKVFYKISGESADVQSILDERNNVETGNIEKKHYSDRKLLFKKVKDFYKSKGSEKSFEFLFRVLFNTDIHITYPKENILRASDGIWSVDKSIRTRTTLDLSEDIIPQRIIGNDTGASAIIEYYLHHFINGNKVTEYFIAYINGKFDDESYTIETQNGTSFYEIGENCISEILIEDAGQSYLEGYPLRVDGDGDGASIYIESVSRGIVENVIVAGSGNIIDVPIYNYNNDNSLTCNVDDIDCGLEVPKIGLVDINGSTPPETSLVFTVGSEHCRSKRPFEVVINLYDTEGEVYVNISSDAKKIMYDFVKTQFDEKVFDVNNDGIVTWEDLILIKRWLSGIRDISLLDVAQSSDTDINGVVVGETLFPNSIDVGGQNSNRQSYDDIKKYLRKLVNENYLDTNFNGETTLDDYDVIIYYFNNNLDNFDNIDTKYLHDSSVTHRLGLPNFDHNNQVVEFSFDFDPFGSYDHVFKFWSQPSAKTVDNLDIIEHVSLNILTEDNSPLILGDYYESANLVTEPYAVMDGAKIKSINIRKKDWGYAGRKYRTGEKLEFDNSLTGGTGAVARILETDNVGGIVKCEVINTGHGYKRAPFVSVEQVDDYDNKSVGVAGLLESRGTFGSIRKIRIKDFGAGYTGTPTIDATGAGAGNAILHVKTGSYCEYGGKYANNNGFLSDTNVVQDNYYYQDYSYVIRVNKQINEWRDIVKKIIHPTGLEFFGEFVSEGFARRRKSRLAWVFMQIEIIKNVRNKIKLMDGANEYSGLENKLIRFDGKGRNISRERIDELNDYSFFVSENSNTSITLETRNLPDLSDSPIVNVLLDGSPIFQLGTDEYPLSSNPEEISFNTHLLNIPQGNHTINLVCDIKNRVALNCLTVYLHDVDHTNDLVNTTIKNEKRGGVNHIPNRRIGALKDGANPRKEGVVVKISKRLHQIESMGTVGRSLDRIKFRFRNTFRFSELRDRYSPQRFTPEEKLFAPYGNTKIEHHDFEDMTIEELESKYERNSNQVLDAYYSVFPKYMWITEEVIREIHTDTLGTRRLSLERYKSNVAQTIEIDDGNYMDISVGEEEDTYNLKINNNVSSKINKRPVVKVFTQTTTWKGIDKLIPGPQWRSLERDKWGYGVDDVEESEFSINHLENNYKYKKNIAIPPSITITKT